MLVYALHVLELVQDLCSEALMVWMQEWWLRLRHALGSEWPQPLPCSLGRRTTFQPRGLQLPHPPAAVLQRTSSTEQLLRIYNGNGVLQCVSAAFSPQTAPENSEHTAPLYSPGFSQRTGQWRSTAESFWKVLGLFCWFQFLQHSKPYIVRV